MPEPFTVGVLVAAMLSAGASEAGKAALGAATKDAYEKLRSLAGRLLGPAVTHLEAKPESRNRAGVVAELVEEQPAATQAELRQLAESLRNALAADGRGAMIDNRITVVASGANSIAAGRDANVRAPTPDE
jgi:hypothetical protein